MDHDNSTNYEKDSLSLTGAVSMGTGAMALLMYFSMIINESLVARTFGTYTLQLFDAKEAQWLVPALGVGLLVFAFFIVTTQVILSRSA